MEDLLNFSFDHIEVLAAKHDATVTSPEKLRLWDYIQRMAVGGLRSLITRQTPVVTIVTRLSE